MARRRKPHLDSASAAARGASHPPVVPRRKHPVLLALVTLSIVAWLSLLAVLALGR